MLKFGKLLFLVAFLLIINIKIYHNFEQENHFKKVEKSLYNAYSTKYIGYLEIKRLGIKRGIVKGITELILNANDIGMEIKKGKIILAGHSIENVFGKLHNIKSDDIILLHINNKIEKYIVNSIKIVDKYDVDALDSELNLITCMYNPNKRLIIGAKKNI